MGTWVVVDGEGKNRRKESELSFEGKNHMVLTGPVMPIHQVLLGV